MMPNDNIEVVRQHQMVVAWIRLRQMKFSRPPRTTLGNLPGGSLIHPLFIAAPLLVQPKGFLKLCN